MEKTLEFQTKTTKNAGKSWNFLTILYLELQNFNKIRKIYYKDKNFSVSFKVFSLKNTFKVALQFILYAVIHRKTIF